MLFDGHPPRRRHHVDDDQRPGGAGVLHDPRRRRARRASTLGKLNGTLQTDIFKEYIAQKEWLFGPEPHLRLIGDLMEYCAEKIPAYKPLSVSGYHIREAGSTAAQELAFTLADGFGYVELGPVARPRRRRRSRPACRFFFDATSTSSRRSPSSAPPAGSGRAGCATSTARKTEKAQWLRFHTQTAGVSLTAQQPYNNVVRTGIEALAAVLGGTNSLHTNALDETLALPSEQAAEIALRTQQVIMEETGVVNVADPLGGSWYVEALTDQIEAEANAIFDKILAMGGSARHADAEGWPSRTHGERPDDQRASCAASRTAGSCPRSPRPPSSTRSRWRRATRRSSASTATPTRSPTTWRSCGSRHEVEIEQVARAGRRARPAATRPRSRAAIAAHGRGRPHRRQHDPGRCSTPCRAEATLGEICDALREEWGEYREPARF